jgi:hypothetical protein
VSQFDGFDGCPSWKFGALCDLILILLGEKDRDDKTVSRIKKHPKKGTQRPSTAVLQWLMDTSHESTDFPSRIVPLHFKAVLTPGRSP